MEIYIRQVNDFAEKHGVKMIILDKTYGYHFIGDNQKRSIFKIKLTRNKKQFIFDFGQSIANGSKEPNMYDILACLQKYDVADFACFMGDFGYKDNKDTRKLYKLVCKEYKNVMKLFGDIIDELQEIN